MEGVPAELWAIVGENVVVQWFLVIVFILLVGTNTATKLKGPLGGFARWMRKAGQARENREAQERRQARQKLLQSAQEGRDYVAQEMHQLNAKIDSLLSEREDRDRLVDAHLAWDYERRLQLINLGVPVNEIPPTPPLRAARGAGRHRHNADADEKTAPLT